MTFGPDAWLIGPPVAPQASQDVPAAPREPTIPDGPRTGSHRRFCSVSWEPWEPGAVIGPGFVLLTDGGHGYLARCPETGAVLGVLTEHVSPVPDPIHHWHQGDA